MLATAVLSGLAGAFLARANPNERLPWRGPLPPSWSFMNTEPWSSTVTRWASFLLGLYTAIRAGNHLGTAALALTLVAMIIPMSVVEGVHNRRVRPGA